MVTRRPCSTYRLQLRPEFGFDAALAVADYLKALGVSHAYLSPYLAAAPNSQHGYDVADPTRVNEDLGGPSAHRRLIDGLQMRGLGQVVDLVPNHMCVTTERNRWWWDVLRHGRDSTFARFFDVDWEGPTELQRDKVLLPILDRHYGEALRAQAFSLQLRAGDLALAVAGRHLPLELGTTAEILKSAAERACSEELSFLSRALRLLEHVHPVEHVTGELAAEINVQRTATLRRISTLLSVDAGARSCVQDELERINRDPEALDSVLMRQHYRLAHYRAARYEMDYRRFFDLHELAGLNAGDPVVFDATHQLPLEWVNSEQVHGLRVDHPDGLSDPVAYFEKLRSAAPHTWIVVEKILQPNEALPPHWPVDGTTGYEFCNRVLSLFVEQANEAKFNELFTALTERPWVPFAETRTESKRFAAENLFSSELERLANGLQAICAAETRHLDFAKDELRQVVRELCVGLPVYRTYVRSASPPSLEDLGYVQSAVEHANKVCPPDVCGFVSDLLKGNCKTEAEWNFVSRFQQLSAAVMAKGLEDTAFYRDVRLVALNEVGGDPGSFGSTRDEFHAFCRKQSETQAFSLVSTATHDTKRGEDTRLRIALLSQIPELWGDTARALMTSAEQYRDAQCIDLEFEYFLWQTLVGTFPISSERLELYLTKAMREAKRHTSWTQANAQYETAMLSYTRRASEDQAVRSRLEQFVQLILPAAYVASLAQTLFKLTAYGVPDIYQGTELWDTSLVDPDNRRAVDFVQLQQELERVARSSPKDVLQHWATGLPKLFVLHRVLSVRRDNPSWFDDGAPYLPLTVSGTRGEQVLAYARGENVIAVAPLRFFSTSEEGVTAPLLPSDFTGTRLDLKGTFRNLFLPDQQLSGEIDLAQLFEAFPVALLMRT